MPDGQVSVAERVQRRLVEDLGHQTHVFEHHDLGAFADRNSGRLLPTVLERVEPEVGELGDLLVRRPDTENPTRILGSAIIGVYVVVQQAVTLCHCLIVTGTNRDHWELWVRA